MLVTAFIALTVLITEALLKIVFRLFDMTRDYVFGGCYRSNIAVVLVYFLFLSFGFAVR